MFVHDQEDKTHYSENTHPLIRAHSAFTCFFATAESENSPSGAYQYYWTTPSSCSSLRLNIESDQGALNI